MDCKEAETRIFEAIDHELAPSDDARLRDHLARCPRCQNAATATRALVDRLRRSASADHAPAHLLRRIRRLLDRCAPRPPAR